MIHNGRSRKLPFDRDEAVAHLRASDAKLAALIDPNGRLLQKTYADDPYREPRPADGILVSAPRMTGGDTLYVRAGDWFVYLCMLATLCLGALAFRSPRDVRRSSTTADAGSAPGR